MSLNNPPAPDLVPVLALPFGALIACVVLGLGVYIAWGRLKPSK